MQLLSLMFNGKIDDRSVQYLAFTSSTHPAHHSGSLHWDHWSMLVSLSNLIDPGSGAGGKLQFEVFSSAMQHAGGLRALANSGIGILSFYM